MFNLVGSRRCVATPTDCWISAPVPVDFAWFVLSRHSETIDSVGARGDGWEKGSFEMPSVGI